VTGDLVTTGVAFLTHPKKFVEKFLAVLGFLSSVIAFLSGLIVTLTWLHILVPLGLNVIVSSFLLMLSFLKLAPTSIVAPVVLKTDVCRQIPLILGGHSCTPQNPQAWKNSRFSPGYLPRFPLEARSIYPPVVDAGK
jgi:hypothetical protein